jgi:hypothetical protein
MCRAIRPRWRATPAGASVNLSGTIAEFTAGGLSLEQVEVVVSRDPAAMAEHGHERHDARSAPDQEDGPALTGIPDEIAADRPAQLDLVSVAQLLAQVAGHLAADEQLDRLRPRARGRRAPRHCPRARGPAGVRPHDR